MDPSAKPNPERINIQDENRNIIPHCYSLRYNGEDLTNNKKLRFFGYARVSTVNQRNSESSIPTQINYIEEECKRRNYCLIAIYIDDGISGSSTENREG